MPSTSASEQMTYGEAVPIFSALASTCVSAALALSARLMCDSSRSPVLSPLQVDAGHAHEVRFGADAADGIDRGCADGDDGMLEQPAAEQDDFDRRMFDERDGDRRTVRDDRCAQIVRQVLCDLQRRRAAVEYHDLAAADQLRRRATDCDFAFGGDLLADREIPDCGRGGQCAAVHTLQLACCGELAQIAPNSVLGQLELATDVLRDDLSVRLQDLENEIFALFREHATNSMHEFS